MTHEHGPGHPDGPEIVERMVRRVMARAAGELARRRARFSLNGVILSWRWRVLMASGVLAVAALLVLLRVDRPPHATVAPADSVLTVEEALGVPGELTSTVRETEGP